jgi:hypothetical protein
MKALSVITLAMKRSMLPPLLVTTANCPSATRVRKDPVTATPERLDSDSWRVTADRTPHIISTPSNDQIQRLRFAPSRNVISPRSVRAKMS